MIELANTVESHFAAGNEHLAAGAHAQAETAFRLALAIEPDHPEIHANLGQALMLQSRFAEADASYREAARLAPEHVGICINYALLLAARKCHAKAEQLLRHALEIEPRAIRAWSNLGVLLATQKREAEAEACYRTALAIDPAATNAAFNLAYILLRQGRYEEGWQRFEARDWYAGIERILGLPRWQGEPLAGKKILIGIEAGHGDMIQFCRYAEQLRARGAEHIGLLCHPALKRLFLSLDAVDELIGLDDALPQTPWDYWVPPLSLPLHFATRLDSIPARLPYLAASAADIASWAERLAPSGMLRVGLAWQGNPRFENDAARSLPSTRPLSPLGELPGIRFYSLQRWANSAPLEATPALPLTDLGGDIQDFADTAAIISNLDLVISVDTAVAHLAGALGKSCWVLLPYHQTDWRWLSERSDSPWYPRALRLFRQPADGDWASVIAEVGTALSRLVNPGF